jgi:hypothetical protein
MTLLLRDPDAQAPAPPAETPPEASVAVPACPKCQTPLAPEQDWCLQCGEAQPGRLASLPGKRAVATVLSLATLMVGGAVAASYAALNHDSPAPATAPTTDLAQVPPAASAAEPAAPVAPQPSTLAPADTAPAPADSGALPTTPSKTTTPAPSTSSTATSTSGTTTSGSTSIGSTTKTSTGTTTTGTTRTSTTTTPAPPKAIAIDGSAAALYDPYKRDTAAGDAAKAVDGDPGTSFPITVADGATQIGAGLVVDLGKTRGLRELDLTTKTPGFRVELYATDSDELPPDVLDTRWAHLHDISDVGTGAGGKQVVSLGSGTTKYRHVLLWITAPPKDGLTVRVSELKLLG